jgi:replicative DNA helicase
MDPRVKALIDKRKSGHDTAPRPRSSAMASDLARELGRIPPQSPDVEEAVLGAMLLESTNLDVAMLLLSPETFYKDSHRLIFEAIVSLFRESKSVDLLTVTNELRRKGTLELVGGAFHLTELTSRLSSSANMESHALILHEKHIKRKILEVSHMLNTKAYDDMEDPLELLDAAYKDLNSLTDKLKLHRPKDIRKIINENLGITAEYMRADREITGVPSGFPALDRITLGWQKSDLIILAARPGMGKTALMLSMAREAVVEHKKKVAIFSLEMSAGQLVLRLQSAEANIPLRKIRSGKMLEAEFMALATLSDNLTSDGWIIDDTSNLSILQMRAACFRMSREHGLDMIIVDYLQLMTGQGQNREQEIGYISRNLKAIAKDLDVPVIALSQLSRAVETRGGDKKPQLSDLRESGGIEQDADLVIFLYRPSYYKIREDASGNDISNMAEIIVAKHRNGPLDSAFVVFNEQYVKFQNMDTDRPVVVKSAVNAELKEAYRVKSPDREDYMDDDNAIQEVPF